MSAEDDVFLHLALPETASSPTQAGCSAFEAIGPAEIVPVAEGTSGVVANAVPLPLVLSETTFYPRPAY